MKRNNPIVEFRRDAVSGDWVLVSSTLQKKPFFFKRNGARALPRSLCPFEGRRLLDQKELLLWLPKPGKNKIEDWWIRIFPNRFPVVTPGSICPLLEGSLLGHKKIGVGFQEVVITRDHHRPLGVMSEKEIALLLEAYTIRFQALQNEPCVEYILIFHNAGPLAGATVSHPHSQILAVPIIPPDVARSIRGSKLYYETHRQCVHCGIVRKEKREKCRVIYENDLFIVIAPYASHASFEMRIFPKVHEAHFEVIDSKQIAQLSQAMSFVFQRLKTKLKNPDFNFFIHTAPPKAKEHHYHWHIEVIPRIAIQGGVELGIGMDIIKIPPEEAAQLLKEK